MVNITPGWYSRGSYRLLFGFSYVLFARLTGCCRLCSHVAIFGQVPSNKLREFLLSEQVTQVNREMANREYKNKASGVYYKVYDWDGEIYKKSHTMETIHFAFTVPSTGSFIVRVVR